MSKEQFIEWNPRGATIALLQSIQAVLRQYAQMGIRLTLRQLYYQLVTKNIIANNVKEYAKLSRLLTDARMAGLVDWDIIEDRVRQPEKHSDWPDIQSLVNTAVRSFRLPRWEDQEEHIELWCEKDALHSVIQPLTDKYHITLMVNRGYSSASAMYDSSKRLLDANKNNLTILYLGDFDPSGEDMVRDIRSRMETFGVHNLEVEKIALTMAQVKQYNLPPNPAKTTDPRSADFIAQHGAESYEVDALPPQVLMKLVEDHITSHMDLDLYDEVVAKEEVLTAKLREAAKTIKT